MKTSELKKGMQFMIQDHPTKKMNTVVKEGECVGVYVVESVDTDKVYVQKLLGNGLKNVMGETEISNEDVETYGVLLQESEYVQRKLPTTVSSLSKLLASGFEVKTNEQREHIRKVFAKEIEKLERKIQTFTNVKDTYTKYMNL